MVFFENSSVNYGLCHFLIFIRTLFLYRVDLFMPLSKLKTGFIVVSNICLQ